MVAKNNITGDDLRTKPSTDAYRDNYDRIFGKKKKTDPDPEPEDTYPLPSEDVKESTADK
jgi:hypothetical protein